MKNTQKAKEDDVSDHARGLPVKQRRHLELISDDEQAEDPKSDTKCKLKKGEQEVHPAVAEQILLGLFGKGQDPTEYPTKNCSVEAWCEMVSKQVDARRINQLCKANDIDQSNKTKKAIKVQHLVQLLSE